MDLNAYWQENKRFVTTVAAGLFVFLIGMLLVSSFVGDDLRSQRRALDTARRQLAKPMLGQADLSAAEEENEALREAAAVLARSVQFRPRERFQLAGSGSASSRYFATVADLRDELIPLAGRSSLALPPDLGLPALAPTREEEVVRYLDALDVVDRVVRLAIDAGVERIEEIRIQLDPALLSGRGLGRVERTKVSFEFAGAPGPLVRLVELSQVGRDEGVLLVHEVDARRSSRKSDEVSATITFVAARLHGLEELELDPEEGA